MRVIESTCHEGRDLYLAAPEGHVSVRVQMLPVQEVVMAVPAADLSQAGGPCKGRGSDRHAQRNQRGLSICPLRS